MTSQMESLQSRQGGFSASLKYDLFANHGDDFKHYLELYAQNPLFQDAHDHEILIVDNPFRRPLRVGDLAFQDFTTPLRRDALNSNIALSANRILLNIYEADFVFLPVARVPESWRDFSRFYDPTAKVLGEIIRPVMEDHLFGFLEQEVRFSGPWTAQVLADYLAAWHETCASAPSPVAETIREARSPADAARYFLIQLAGDYLTEASVMARNVLGSYGAGLSELFKVLIDEYGNGVHAAKHSTLFERALESVGLSSGIHAYWQFYLPTSFLTNNYFHSISKNHQHFFRYLGGLFNTEVALVSATRSQSRLLKSIFGTDGVDARYFDEHTHIDRFHGDMAFTKLIAPVLRHFGDAVVPEILRGFEHVRLLQEIADKDLVAQIRFFDGIDAQRKNAERLYTKIQAGEFILDLDTFVEALGERSTTHIHDQHRLLAIEQGEMDFWPRHGDPLHLVPGDVLFIPRGRLHGSVVTTERCVYHQPIVPPEIAKDFFGDVEVVL